MLEIVALKWTSQEKNETIFKCRDSTGMIIKIGRITTKKFAHVCENKAPDLSALLKQ